MQDTEEADVICRVSRRRVRVYDRQPFAVRLEPDVQDALYRAARRHNKPAAVIVRAAIIRFIGEHPSSSS